MESRRRPRPVVSQVNAAKAQRFECLHTPANEPLSDASQCGLAVATHWLPVDANSQADCAHEKDLQMQAFSKTADGIRTHDLLHGKQCVWCTDSYVVPVGAGADRGRPRARRRG